MRATRLMTCLWPGLAELWWRGSLGGLLVAASFASLVNLTIVVSFIWPELVGTVVPTLGWSAVAAVWCLSLLRSFRHLPQSANNQLPDADVDLFVQAQAEYLRGHWAETESLLLQQLESQPGDADSMLLLATLYRQRKRCEDADAQLAALELRDAGAKWQWEIRCERLLLDRIEDSEPEEPFADAAAA